MSNFNWGKFNKISKVIQLIAVVVSMIAIIAIPYQIQQTRNQIGMNSFDALWKLDTRLRENKNHQIFLSIEHNRGGISRAISGDDLDAYLDDITSISAAYNDQRIISFCDAYGWFYYYVVDSYNNPDVKKYIENIRKDANDNEIYQSFDDMYKDFKSEDSKNTCS